MKKGLIAILAGFCLFAAPVSALEWGGLFNDETKVSKTGVNMFHQANSLFLWANTPVVNESWKLSAEAMYKFSLDSVDGTSNVSNVIDVDLLKISGGLDLGAGKLLISAGRFLYSDITGANFSQCCDGLALNFNHRVVHVGAYAGYTGLLNGLNVPMTNIVPDVNAGKIYYLAHPYIPLAFSFEFPSILGNQSLSIQWESFLDLKSEKYNRNYASLSLTGPIVGNVFYTFATSLGIVDSDLMNYTKLVFSAYPTEAFAFNAGVEYGSGDQGPFKPYVTFTPKTAYSTAPSMGGYIVPAVDASYTVGSLYASAAVKTPLEMPETSCKFKGIEGNVSFIYNIFSDFQVELDVNGFKDVAASGAEDSIAATLKFAITF